MLSLPRSQIDEPWDRFWSEMRHEWFKLEVLQDYSGEDDNPSLQAWLKGDKRTAIELLKTDPEPEFTADCRQKRDQGVNLVRIHAVIWPLTPYVEWEIENYRLVSVPLRGEQVFLIDKAKIPDLVLPAGDLMLFDDDRAIVNSYDQTGRLAKAGFYDRGDDLSQFLKLKIILKSSQELSPIV